MGHTDENAGERTTMGGGLRGCINRLGVVLSLDVTGIGIVRGGDGGIPYTMFVVCGGEVWGFSEMTSS